MLHNIFVLSNFVENIFADELRLIIFICFYHPIESDFVLKDRLSYLIWFLLATPNFYIQNVWFCIIVKEILHQYELIALIFFIVSNFNMLQPDGNLFILSFSIVINFRFLSQINITFKQR